MVLALREFLLCSYSFNMAASCCLYLIDAKRKNINPSRGAEYCVAFKGLLALKLSAARHSLSSKFFNFCLSILIVFWTKII